MAHVYYNEKGNVVINGVERTPKPIDDLKELLPCPFCGTTPIKNKKEGVSQILCPNCLTEKTGFSFDNAISKWNRRSYVSEMQK